MFFITNKHIIFVVGQAQAVFRLSLSSRFLRERNYSVITDPDPRSSRVDLDPTKVKWIYFKVDPDPGRNKWLHSNRKKEMHVISQNLPSESPECFRVSLRFDVP